MRFISDKHRQEHARLYSEAKELGFTDEELDKPDLCYLSHQTKSRRYWHLITTAFYVGYLVGIKHCSETFKDRDQASYDNITSWILRDATQHDKLSCDFSTLTLEVLLKKTKSERVLHFMHLAFWLGKLRGIAYCDELFYTKLSLS